MATITTVGYGDMVPVSTVGRAMGYVLMLGGIAFFSGITANLASFLVKGRDTRDKALHDLVAEVEGLRKEMGKLKTE
jgi:voltage-gated potassium channel